MIWFHGTTKEKWKEIRNEGVLFGVRGQLARCTYLATRPEEARSYGEVLLLVDYAPGTHPDNYDPESWQIRVYGPIPLSDVKQVTIKFPCEAVAHRDGRLCGCNAVNRVGQGWFCGRHVMEKLREKKEAPRERA